MNAAASAAPPETVPLQTEPLNSGPQTVSGQNAPTVQYAYNPVPQQPVRIGAQPHRMSSTNRKIVFIGLGIYCAVAVLFIIVFVIVFLTAYNKTISEINKIEEENRRHDESFRRNDFSNTNW